MRACSPSLFFDEPQMECPVCLTEAKDINQHPSPEFRYRGIVVECRGCGLYRVTEHALPKLRTLQLEDRFAALKKARTLAARRLAPTISTGCLPIQSE
jgi:hypothetical protein